MARLLPSVLITGASAGIGAVYADRFARRGHDLVLVARDQARMEELAARLRAEAEVKIDVVRADLAETADLARIEARLRDDDSIGILVNNAGVSAPGGLAGGDLDAIDRLIRVNITASHPPFRRGRTPLSRARRRRDHQHRFGARRRAGIFLRRVRLEQGLRSDPVAKSPGRGWRARRLRSGGVARGDARRTEIWAKSGHDVNALKGVMEVDELVDAALIGFDRRELVTIPRFLTPANGRRSMPRGRRCFRTSPTSTQRRAIARAQPPSRLNDVYGVGQPTRSISAIAAAGFRSLWPLMT